MTTEITEDTEVCVLRSLLCGLRASVINSDCYSVGAVSATDIWAVSCGPYTDFGVGGRLPQVRPSVGTTWGHSFAFTCWG